MLLPFGSILILIVALTQSTNVEVVHIHYIFATAPIFVSSLESPFCGHSWSSEEEESQLVCGVLLVHIASTRQSTVLRLVLLQL